MLESLKIQKTRQIAASPETVWSVLTDPEEIKKWLGVETTSRWTTGSDLLFTFEWEGKEYADKGKIIRFEVEKTFIYSYWSGFSGLPDSPENYSKIEFHLKPTNIGVSLDLIHSEFATETMYQHSDKNWENTLDTIKDLSEEKVKQ